MGNAGLKRKRTSCDTAPKFNYFPRKAQPNDDPLARRILLLGKTGAGKSAAANTILGKKRFISELCPSSVTKESEVEQAVVAGRKVTIVDTPGLFDTSMSAENLAVEIGRSVYLSSPGPHAFLYVLKINSRFTEQEEEVVHKFEMMFGMEMRKYTIILFTQGDQLEGKSPDSLIKKNKSLCRLVEQCGGFHVFNNKDLRNKKQVTELMEKIDRMVKKNGGSCYSNQMFEDAARIKQEEERRRMEEEARQQREEQKLHEIKRMKKEVEEAVENMKKREKKVKEQEEKLEKAKLKVEEDIKHMQLKIEVMEKLNDKYRCHLDAAGEMANKQKTKMSSGGAGMGAGMGADVGTVLGGLIGLAGGPLGLLHGTVVGEKVGGAMGAAVGGIVEEVVDLFV